MPNASRSAVLDGTNHASIPAGRSEPALAKGAHMDVRVLRTRYGKVTLRRDQVVKDTRDEEIKLLSLDPLVGLRLSQNTIHRYGDDGMELGLLRGPRLNFWSLAEPQTVVQGWVSRAGWQEREPGVFVMTLLRDKPADGDCVFVRQVEDDGEADRVMEQIEQIAQRLVADTENATKAAAKRMQDVIDRFRRQKLAGKAGG